MLTECVGHVHQLQERDALDGQISFSLLSSLHFIMKSKNSPSGASSPWPGSLLTLENMTSHDNGLVNVSWVVLPPITPPPHLTSLPPPLSAGAAAGLRFPFHM